MFHEIINVHNKDELFNILSEIHYETIFHRCWMGSYCFAADIVKNYEHVFINIKDWNFASQEVYDFLYPHNNDFKSMEYIFKYSAKVLSHFTEEQYKIWAKEYNIDQDKFIFFPEYCNEDTFVVNKEKLYKSSIKLVYAGKIPSPALPEDYFPGKSHLRSIKLLTKQKINIDFVLPPDIYNDVYSEPKKFMDFIYLNKMNNKFKLLKGEVLNPTLLSTYHFGFFELETTGTNHMLYKYAITSKFAFYLEASLPMLVNEKFYSMAKLVKNNHLGIVFSNDDLENLNEILKISNKKYQKMVKNIIEFRKKFTYKDVNLQTLGII